MTLREIYELGNKVDIKDYQDYPFWQITRIHLGERLTPEELKLVLALIDATRCRSGRVYTPYVELDSSTPPTSNKPQYKIPKPCGTEWIATVNAGVIQYETERELHQITEESLHNAFAKITTTMDLYEQLVQESSQLFLAPSFEVVILNRHAPPAKVDMHSFTLALYSHQKQDPHYRVNFTSSLSIGLIIPPIEPPDLDLTDETGVTVVGEGEDFACCIYEKEFYKDLRQYFETLHRTGEQVLKEYDTTLTTPAWEKMGSYLDYLKLAEIR